MDSQTCGHLMERSCIKAKQKIKLNDTAISVLYMLFTFFWGGGDGGGGRVGFLFLSFSLFQNICFNDSALLISNIFIKNLKYSTILNL